MPWGSTLGEVRTYVHRGAEFDPDRWFAGLKAGRTFGSNGPALDFTVDDSLPGTELKRNRGDHLNVFAKVRSHEKTGAPAVLRLVSNDGALKELAAKGNEMELSLRVEVPLEGSLSSSLLTTGAEREGGRKGRQSIRQ